MGSVDVSEVYSPPRVTARAPDYGLKPGTAMDLATGWDFNHRSERKQAHALLRSEDPQATILSPFCAPWSQMNRLNRERMGEAAWADMRKKARVHLRFCVEIARWRHSLGRGFVFEQPLHLDSWKDEESSILRSSWTPC